MQKQDYPYCPHGNYVGGCGADYMCGQCEMGDEPLSINTLRLLRRNSYTTMAHFLNLYMNLCGLTPALWQGFALVNRDLVQRFLNDNAAIDRQIAEISVYATDDDDTTWLWKQHDARIKAWHEMDGDDQFESLPSYVLDGA